MKKKGQMGNLGMLIIVAVAIIVGVVLFQVIAQEVGSSTNTIAVANESISTVENNTPQYLTNYKSLTDVVVFNETGDAEIDSSYYTVTNNVIDPTTGGLAVNITPGNIPENYTSAWQVSGTGQPTTYISESGGRAAANLIVIFFALAVLAVALYPIYKGELGKLVGM